MDIVSNKIGRKRKMMSLTFKFKKLLFNLLIVVGIYTFFSWYKYTHPEIVPGSSGFNFNMDNTTAKNTSHSLSVAQEPLANKLDRPQVASEKPATQDDTKLDFAKIDSSKPITVNGQSYMLFSPTEVADLHNWMSDRGYFREQDKEVYKNYSDEVLKELGKRGDILALDILTSRAFKVDDRKSATLYLNLATIYGSTGALDDLMIYTAPNSTNDATEETRRPAALETLAVSKLIAMRGDRSLSVVAQRGFINSYKNLYGVDLVLTPQEQQLVDNRAQEMYDQLQTIRRAKGLGDFDNSEPSGVKKFFGLK